MNGLWATKSEGVGLIVHAISFQDYQPMCHNPPTLQTDDMQLQDPALCTILHRMVKHYFYCILFLRFWSVEIWLHLNFTFSLFLVFYWAFDGQTEFSWVFNLVILP